MHRRGCSRPVALAISQGLVTSDTTFFDYGCGRGGDLRYLNSLKISAAGWDPHYQPRSPRRTADVVNLGYVLNVIEDPRERLETLRAAHDLAQRLLVVSVRVDNSLDPVDSFADGHLTRTGTFQKIFEQDEFKQYVEIVLGQKPTVAGLGILYVFKDEELRARYLANRAFATRFEYRADLIQQFRDDRIAKRYIAKSQELGRAPLPEEFPSYTKLLDRFGSPETVQRLLLSQIDIEAFTGTRDQRKEDILTFLATMRLQGVKAPQKGNLPPTVRADIDAMWPRYSAAVDESESLLFRIGNSEEIAAACKRARVGKLVADDLYLHRSLEPDLPPPLRLVVAAARMVTGELDYTLLKLRLDGRAVSFLQYRDFDEVAHPPLVYSVRVYLPRASYQVRNFAVSRNPPILHRKDTLVSGSYPGYARFRALTLAEEDLGLLNRADIGTFEQWRALLKATGTEIVGHEIRTIPSLS